MVDCYNCHRRHNGARGHSLCNTCFKKATRLLVFVYGMQQTSKLEWYIKHKKRISPIWIEAVEDYIKLGRV
jgi:hypothetical protein